MCPATRARYPFLIERCLIWLDLAGKAHLSSVVLGYHHQPGGILVQSVHYAGANRAADSLEVRVVGEEGIYQCTSILACGGGNE